MSATPLPRRIMSVTCQLVLCSRRRRISTMLLLLIQVFLPTVQAEDSINYDYHCTDQDSKAVDSSVSLQSLQPNVFHKICPGRQTGNSQFLGQPSCGDGSAFAFYVARPTQRKANSYRVMIEFAGGGACWNAQTCEYGKNYLSFPQQWNDFVGLSCSELEQAMQQQNKAVSMLCGKQVGSVVSQSRPDQARLACFPFCY